MLMKELYIVKKAGDLLNIFFNDVQKSEGEQFSNFHKSWEKIAGEKIGHNTKIHDVVDGNLIIEIDHPGWKQLILMKEKSIIRQIKKDFPQLKVEKVKFYFNDRVKVVKKDSVTENEIYTKTTDNSDISGDFLSLLKKMNKRSEE